ncbi:hypothetical protein ACJU26_01835 [Acidithiobacillus sp. M4-SHS-6]|uniref:hypothetical protein n=1 Tax=Acidithiobacillus sp. M4-SHS-6 TaxID=3383024 RepID=UPI0039BE8659
MGTETMIHKQYRQRCSQDRERGQSMIEYLVVALAVIVLLLAPMPSVVPGKTTANTSILTQLSEALRGFYSDYSWAVSQP